MEYNEIELKKLTYTEIENSKNNTLNQNSRIEKQG